MSFGRQRYWMRTELAPKMDTLSAQLLAHSQKGHGPCPHRGPLQGAHAGSFPEEWKHVYFPALVSKGQSLHTNFHWPESSSLSPFHLWIQFKVDDWLIDWLGLWSKIWACERGKELAVMGLVTLGRAWTASPLLSTLLVYVRWCFWLCILKDS